MNKLSSINPNTRRFGGSKSISQIIDAKHSLPILEVPVTPSNSPIEPAVVEPAVVEPVVEPVPKLIREDSTIKRQIRAEFLARFKK